MKKILLKAFTLIELIIVISIITLISTASVFYFVDFINNQEITQKIKLIENDLLELDKNIKNYKIFDYEIKMNTSSLSGKYIIYKNIFDLTNSQSYITNTEGFTGTIRTTGPNSLTGTLKLYKGSKLFLNSTKTGSVDFDFNFNEKQKYKILGTLSGELLNEIHLNYYSQDNLTPKRNNTINLIEISTTKDKTGPNISNLIIKNIGGNKKFYSGSLSNEITNKEIYLFFKNKGIEKFIKITK